MTPAPCATCGNPLPDTPWMTRICGPDCVDAFVDAGLARPAPRAAGSAHTRPLTAWLPAAPRVLADEPLAEA